MQKAGGITKISWTTEQELNSKDFTVERSTDGGRSWTSIAVLPASGNSSSKRSYSIVDNSPAKGINLYRLRSTDTDNKFTNSDTRAVLFANKDVVFITPGPASNFLNIFLSKTDISLTRILVTDANGRVVEKISTPEQSYRINTSGYVKGMYVVKV